MLDCHAQWAPSLFLHLEVVGKHCIIDEVQRLLMAQIEVLMPYLFQEGLLESVIKREHVQYVALILKEDIHEPQD